jgi:hypothetical protein
VPKIIGFERYEADDCEICRFHGSAPTRPQKRGCSRGPSCTEVLAPLMRFNCSYGRMRTCPKRSYANAHHTSPDEGN